MMGRKLTERGALRATRKWWAKEAKTGEELPTSCALCRYSHQHTHTNESICSYCPYYKRFGNCHGTDSLLIQWHYGYREQDPVHRKHYASMIVAQLNELLEEVK